MTTYERTHPWIKFRADYRELSFKTWIRLGEAQSKCEHISGVPLLPAVAQQLHQVYLAKGVLATTAIEGNTLTEKEVMRRLEGKLSLPPSKEYLGQAVDNILAACNETAREVLTGQPIELTVDKIKYYNALVLHKLPIDKDVVPGEIRRHSVGVGSYRGAPPEDCDFLLERFCEWLNNEVVPPEEEKVLFGILKAIVAHVYFAWIHPFGDGNGRTARLIEFQILLSSGVPSAAAQLLSNHYNLTRSEYYRQLEITSRSGGDLNEFINYAVQGFVDGLREQLTRIRAQQLLVHWRDYVYDRFRDHDSMTDRRRRRLVLDLTVQTEYTPISKLRHITPKVAELYAGKTDKTIKRDLNILEEMGLIHVSRKGVLANFGLMLAFQPATRIEEIAPPSLEWLEELGVTAEELGL